MRWLDLVFQLFPLIFVAGVHSRSIYEIPPTAQYELVPGSPLSQGLLFTAYACKVDNPTLQWVHIINTLQYIPPQVTGYVVPIPGLDIAGAEFAAPPGVAQPAALPGQQAVLTYYSYDLPPSGATLSVSITPASTSVDWINVKSIAYGAKGDGVTDDTKAVQAAINAAAAGQVVYASFGTYVLTNQGTTGPGGAKVALTLLPNVNLYGAGRAVTIFKMGNNQQALGLLISNVSHATIQDITFDGNQANNADTGIDGAQTAIYGSANVFCHFQRLELKNWTRQGIYISNGSWLTFLDVYAERNGLAGNTLAGIEVDALTYTDLISCKANANAGPGMHIVGGAVLTDNNVTVLGGTFFGNQFGIQVVFARGSRIVGCRCRSNSQDGILALNSDGLGITDVYSELNSRHGIYYNSTTGSYVVGSTCRNNNFGGAQNANGIYTNTAVTDCMFSDNRCYDDQGAKTQQYGIALDVGSESCTLVANDVKNNATGGINVLAGVAHRIYANPGYNPLGVAAIVVAASPFTYTNNDNVPEFVSIDGGTITTVVKNGITVYSFGGTTPHCGLHLEPTEAVTVTYTVAPTMNKDRH